MSGTRSPSRTEPPTEGRWPLWKLGLLLYPFVAAAVAINLFMLGLMGQAVGLSALSPLLTLALSVPLGLPATWLAARWVRHLIDEAGG
ncbi:hypothetical protein [Defluviimonas sp. SAOS-178_SWC]|uniref:hypothetical protein n=1 Tax=Defluviimonas sp. SAOS-178_SWC TaxID=3121287 RepID=UPI003221B8E0